LTGQAARGQTSFMAFLRPVSLAEAKEAKEPKDVVPEEYVLARKTVDHILTTELAIMNAGNFAATRLACLARMLGVPEDPRRPGEITKKSVEELIKTWLACGINPASSEEDARELAKALMEGSLSAYEVVGQIKDLTKNKIKGGDMRTLWIKLSAISGLKALGNQAIAGAENGGVDWEKKGETEAVVPKLEALAQSLGQEAASGSTKRKNYVENHPHLANSRGLETNWSEILTSLPSEQAKVFRCLLESSATNIKKAEAWEAATWKNGIPVAASIRESRRLNNLLDTLGNRPKGRVARLQRVLLRMERTHDPVYAPLPKNLPTLPPPTTGKDRREAAKAKKIVEEAKQLIEEVRTPQAPDAPKRGWKGPVMAVTLRKLSAFPSDAHPELEETLKTCREIVEEETKKECTLEGRILEALPGRLTRKLEEDGAARPDPGMALREKDACLHLLPIATQREILAQKCSEIKNGVTDSWRNTEILKLIRKLRPIEELGIDPTAEPFNRCEWVALHQTKNIETKLPAGGRGRDIIEAAEGKKDLDLDKRYGKTKLSLLHMASWWPSVSYGLWETGIIGREMLRKKRGVSPQTTLGDTPLHKAREAVVEKLLMLGANPCAKNKEGKQPFETTTGASPRIIKEAAAKAALEARLRKQSQSGLEI
jgi:hypothetical protein